jgi:hypothetical protein
MNILPFLVTNEFATWTKVYLLWTEACLRLLQKQKQEECQ